MKQKPQIKIRFSPKLKLNKKQKKLKKSTEKSKKAAEITD